MSSGDRDGEGGNGDANGDHHSDDHNGHGDDCHISAPTVKLQAHGAGVTLVRLVVTNGVTGCSTVTTVTITVAADTQPPVITCPPDITIASDDGAGCATRHDDDDGGGCYFGSHHSAGDGDDESDHDDTSHRCTRLASPVVTDNCGPVTFKTDAPRTFPVGTTCVHWTATDASGNTATCTQKVTVLPSCKVTVKLPLACAPTSCKVTVGQTACFKIDARNWLNITPAACTAYLNVQGIQVDRSGNETVFQDVVEDTNDPKGRDGTGPGSGCMWWDGGQYVFNLMIDDFSDGNTASETNRFYRARIIVRDNATNVVIGQSACNLETCPAPKSGK